MDIASIDTSTVADICADLIRIDSSNYGPGNPSTVGEVEAAEYCLDFLRAHGYEPEVYWSDEISPNIIVRVQGRARRDALIVHGHLDAVPAIAEDWSVDPFGGVIKDGYVWGRGAVDMKNMVAMMLVVLADMKIRDWQPERDMIFAFLADEEAGGVRGCQWLVRNKPEVFAGATEAISEVGGYSVEIGGKRVYLIQTGEKGLHWMRMTAHGTAGHGSQVNDDNAVTRLATAMSAIGSHEFERHLTGTVDQLLRLVAELTGLPFSDKDEDIEALLSALGPARRFVEATLSSRANPTQLNAGYKVNVIPGTACGTFDLRPLPGHEEADLATLKELAGPGVTIEAEHADIGYEYSFETDIVSDMLDALRGEDPDAIIAPYLLSAGTDNKSLYYLGITGYGFVPAALPADFDFPAAFHGVDERIPVSTLEFGTRVLARFCYGHA